ncbi:MAG: hypothetical protein ACI9TY_001796 [Alphaproteobacteria bacterium]|jgi:hypothetical protein
MKDQKTKTPLFPVDKSEADSLKQLTEKLNLIAAQNKPLSENNEIAIDETIADDFDVSAEEFSKIQSSENDMRGLLKTMGLNYDALIRMDEKSVYARAIAANPAVLDFVKSSKKPVFEAVKIALGFKPYAEFMDKYGSEPADILKNIRSEYEGENKEVKQNDVLDNASLTEALNRPSFSSAVTGNSKGKNKSTDVQTFNDIFNK